MTLRAWAWGHVARSKKGRAHMHMLGMTLRAWGSPRCCKEGMTLRDWGHVARRAGLTSWT